jgi:hypothetical protein
MADYEEVLRRARALSPAERARLAGELQSGTGLPSLGRSSGPAPHTVGWLKAERGHAVLATDTGPAEADIPAGAEAIAGMWADRKESAG